MEIDEAKSEMDWSGPSRCVWSRLGVVHFLYVCRAILSGWVDEASGNIAAHAPGRL